jgi:hypothetical protein
VGKKGSAHSGCEPQASQGCGGLGDALGSELAEVLYCVLVALLGGARVPQDGGLRVSQHTPAQPFM